MVLTLVIGNRNYSSWSLRAWLYMKQSRIPFTEIRIPLHVGNWRREIAKYSPAGRVPILLDGDTIVWDSLAIMEHLRERFPEGVGWPSDAAARAHARSISAEMHAGFLAIREELPQNLRIRKHLEVSEAAKRQIDRVCEIWGDCRSRYRERGPWLLGDFSIADVMYAPVALRFVSYSVPVTGLAQEFIDAIQTLRPVQDWVKEAEAEEERVTFIDELRPGDMTLG